MGAASCAPAHAPSRMIFDHEYVHGHQCLPIVIGHVNNEHKE